MVFERSKPVSHRRLDAHAFEAAQRLRQARLMRGLHARDVADGIGVPTERVYFWEKQFGQLAVDQSSRALAAFLRVPVNWLTDGLGKFPGGDKLLASCLLSAAERGQLGERAKARRKVMRLSRRALGEQIGATNVPLFYWEKCLPLYPRPQELLWAVALAAPAGWLRDTGMPAVPDAGNAAATGPAIGGEEQ
jgi:transcriptional regulator with XRE-family HTH domain